MRIFRGRKYWVSRAVLLHGSVWHVGRTDIQSYDAYGRMEHYAYPPNWMDGKRVKFMGHGALKRAVLFAEKMNKAK